MLYVDNGLIEFLVTTGSHQRRTNKVATARFTDFQVTSNKPALVYFCIALYDVTLAYTSLYFYIIHRRD